MTIRNEDALEYHAVPTAGKLSVTPTKPCRTQRDLSLAYSPGVAVPCKAIEREPGLAYKYTAKGNLVAVVSNGTAVLGLGNIGAQAGKPVMEGKAVLFKRFADIDVFDIELASEDPKEIIRACQMLEPTFGGINLEDIKAPECFEIEQELKRTMQIPVFHDDQHGTAIITAAGLINALYLTGRDIKDIKVVVNGAGSAGIACLELVKAMGLPHENALLCDTKGVIYKGRTEGMNQWKSAHAVTTKRRTLEEAMEGADVVLGLSVKGALTPKMIKSMAPKPIIFAMANPDPEITPEEVAQVRDDAIVATGRSDYPNQVNNVLGFPYIFRGALDVRATSINEEMKIACAQALAKLAREDVPDEVAAAYQGERPRFGPGYIIPVPFDPRLIREIPPAVAKAAMDSGVARHPIVDMEAYKNQLSARLSPTAGMLQVIFDKVRRDPKRVVFAEGEEERVIRAAITFRDTGLGHPILVGREELVRQTLADIGLDPNTDLDIRNARLSDRNPAYSEFLYNRLQRQGYLLRDCVRLVNNDRNVFSACMVEMGDADAMVTGVTRNYAVALEDALRVIDPIEGRRVMGVTLVVARGQTVLVADTNVHEMPTSEELADIAVQTAEVARRLGYEPRVAMLSSSTFGNPMHERSERLREAVEILEARQVDFEFDGEMAADVALSREAMALYPFCRLSDTANVLIMPAIHSAAISTKLLKVLGQATLIGPLLVGLKRPVQIVPIGSNVSDLVNMAALAAYNLDR
jgi:malate dehydrogenase (oxaloacetate-decarboxylating)(NADP+)